MSSQILKERKEYYLQLEAAEQGTLDITAYLSWFLSCLDRAHVSNPNIERSEVVLEEGESFNPNLLLMTRPKKVMNNYKSSLNIK